MNLLPQSTILKENLIIIMKYITHCVMLMPNHKYIIKINGKVAWEGLDIATKFREFQKKYPNKKISMSWIPTKEDLLIV